MLWPARPSDRTPWACSGTARKSQGQDSSRSRQWEVGVTSRLEGRSLQKKEQPEGPGREAMIQPEGRWEGQDAGPGREAVILVGRGRDERGS